MIKLLMISRIHKGEGPTTVLSSILPYLKKYDIKVDFLCVTEKPEMEEEIFENLKYFNTAECFLKKFDIDILDYDLYHFHGVFVYQFIPIADYLLKNKKKYIITTHGNLMKNALNFHNIRKKLYLKYFANKYFKFSNLIHVLSELEKNDVLKIYKNINTYIIPNGTFSRKSINIEYYSKNSEILTFTFIGRLDVQHKGIDLLLDAFEIASNKLLKKIELNLYGPFNTKKDEKYIINRIKSSHVLSKNVHILGSVYGKDKDIALCSSDIFVHTSRYEGMPMSVLEAMQIGIPLILTKETNMEDIVMNSNCGSIVSLDKYSIANGIMDMANLSQLILKKMGKDGKNYVDSFLDWEMVAKRYYCMYKTILN